MTAAKKFIFETDFDAYQALDPKPDEIVEEDEPVQEAAPTYSEEELAAAREEAHAAGKQEGTNEAADAIDLKIASTLAAIEGSLSELFRAQEKANETTLKSAITIARKLFPSLDRKRALGKVENLVVTAMEMVMDDTKVTIHVNEDLKPGLEQRIETLIKDCEGKLTVLGDAAMAPGDCRIEWKEGGAERNAEAMWKEIDLIIENNIGGGDESEAAADDPDRGAEAPPSVAPPKAAQDAPPEADEAPGGDSDTSGEDPPNG